ncbi:hypothetical protein BDN70DRAFT_887190 [Pholiota conissans]|uniref:Uncharacterized protein n=1 Tax=Pholiota conissans TaxID=109636 RepID=A0A9P5YRB8_9AGAR|nr:hypothetical protein BDN70DRAFT_887190 [Pholiota conissans]
MPFHAFSCVLPLSASHPRFSHCLPYDFSVACWIIIIIGSGITRLDDAYTQQISEFHSFTSRRTSL